MVWDAKAKPPPKAAGARLDSGVEGSLVGPFPEPVKTGLCRRVRGGLSALDTLQEGQGMPAPPQPQAFAPSQGRSE